MGKTLRNSRKLRWFFLSCIIILSAAAIATLVAVLLFAFDVTNSGTAVLILCSAVHADEPGDPRACDPPQ